MTRSTLAVMFLVACGAAKQAPPPVKPDPIPATAGPSCAAVADHLATLAQRDPTLPAQADPALKARCLTDAWNDAVRNCMATANDDGEVDGCVGMLPEKQRAGLGSGGGAAGGGAVPNSTRAIVPAEPASAPGGADKADKADGAKKKDGDRRSRGPAQKSRGGDPCEGGE